MYLSNLKINTQLLILAYYVNTVKNMRMQSGIFAIKKRSQSGGRIVSVILPFNPPMGYAGQILESSQTSAG